MLGASMSDTAVLGEYEDALADRDLIKIMRQAERETTTALGVLKGVWERNLRAFHARHWEGSKYTKPEYASRSKVFRPKTRAAVLKNMATAATAMFSTNDVVAVKAELESDDQTKAAAEVKNELLNYRLDRTSRRGGIPWFRVAMGAVFNAQLFGICVSKQDWEYRTIVRKKKRTVVEPILHPDTGEQLIDYETGQPFENQSEEEYEEVDVVADRPICELFPQENVWVDLRGNWENPAQDGSYLVLRKSMSVGSLKEMMGENKPHNRVRWLEVDVDVMRDGARDYDAQGMRTARRGNALPDAETKQDAPDDDFRTVWLHENFFRFGGEDYHWYSLGTSAFLSEVACTGDIYPQYFGQRPVTMGAAAIEPHVIYAQSPVEALQGLQTEMNDLANLHLDAVRQSIEPIAKFKAGALSDIKQLRTRGSAGASIMVNDMEGLEFDRTPEPSGQAYIAQQHLNADFDDLSGAFSGGSVQTSRSLNETVGGMRLLAGAANAMTEFNLRVFVETWVEPTLRQIMQSIQYYETDETVLAIAGQRAGLMERYNIDKMSDDMLEAEVAVSVNVGVGAVDPMQSLQKLGVALKMISEAAMFADRDVSVDIEELIGEVMGQAGFKEGMRFFKLGESGKKSKPPEAQKAELDAAAKAAELALKERMGAQQIEADAQSDQLDAIVAVVVEAMKQREAQRAEQVQIAANHESQLADIGARQADSGLRALTTLAGGEQRRITAGEANATRERTAAAAAAAKQQQAKSGGTSV
jgi:hypothetical protein